VTVDPTVDTSVEPDETVALTLTAGTGYTIGTSGAVVGTITNDDAATTPPSTPTALPRPTLITAVDLDGNNSPISGEGADKAFDGTLHGSYTNLGGANSGIEFTYDADKGEHNRGRERISMSSSGAALVHPRNPLPSPISLHAHERLQSHRLEIVGADRGKNVGVGLAPSLHRADEQHMHGVASGGIGMFDKHIEA
jgi:hypothetical protein